MNMWRVLILVVLIVSVALPSVAAVEAQWTGCEGRVHLDVKAVEIKTGPWGVHWHYLWAGEGFDISERREVAPGHWMYRIAFTNTPTDPAIYWINAEGVVLETPERCAEVFRGQ